MMRAARVYLVNPVALRQESGDVIRVVLQPGAYDFRQPKHKETEPK